MDPSPSQECSEGIQDSDFDVIQRWTAKRITKETFSLMHVEGMIDEVNSQEETLTIVDLAVDR